MTPALDLSNLQELDLLRESVDIECKLSQGQDGQGQLPKDFWPSYSSMANTDGGYILLGVGQKKAVFMRLVSPIPPAFGSNWSICSPTARRSAPTY